MKISIIGAGAMGGAMAEGLIKGDYIKNEDICISDPSRISRDKFADMGITATPSNQLAAQGADVVCVVVKPWLVEQVLKGIREVMDYDKQTLIVVAAGVKSESIKEWMTKDGGKMIPTFLVIPNIAIAQLASMTFIAPAAAVDQPHTDMVKDLFLATPLTKLSAMAMSGQLKELKKKLDYSEFGAAPLLGIKGAILKMHGSSNANAVRNAILKSRAYAGENVVEIIDRSVNEYIAASEAEEVKIVHG